MTQEFSDPLFKAAICIGADPGDAGHYDTWLSDGLERLVLIEPDPLRTAQLEQALEQEDTVQILTALPGVKDAPHKMQVYNFPGLRGLNTPTDYLQDILPGLQMRREVGVSELPVATLLQEAGPLPGPVVMRVDLIGSELDVLRAWQAAGDLIQVARLEIRCAQQAVFQGDGHRAAIQSWVQDQGFRLTDIQSSDPDWPVLIFEIDPQAEAFALLQDELMALSETHRDAESGQLRAEKALEDLTDQMIQLEEQLVESRTLQTKRDSQHGTQVAQLEKALQKALHKAEADLKAQTKAAQRQQDTLQRNVSRLENMLSARRTERDEARAGLNTRTRDLAAMEKAHEALQAKATQAEETARDQLDAAQAALTAQEALTAQAETQAESQAKIQAEAHAQTQAATEAKLEAMRVARDQLAADLDMRSSERDEARAALDSQGQALAAMEKAHEALQAKAAQAEETARDQHRDLRDQLDAAQAALTAQEALTAQAESQAESQAKIQAEAHAQTQAATEAELEAMRVTRDQLAADLDMRSSERDEARAALDSQGQALAKAEQALQDMQNTERSLSAAVTRAETQLARTTETHARQLDKLLTERDEARVALKAAKRAQARSEKAARSGAERADAAKAKARAKEKDLSGALRVAQRQATKAEAALAKRVTEHDAAKTALRSATAALARGEKAQEANEKKIEVLKKEAKEAAKSASEALRAAQKELSETKAALTRQQTDSQAALQARKIEQDAALAMQQEAEAALDAARLELEAARAQTESAEEALETATETTTAQLAEKDGRIRELSQLADLARRDLHRAEGQMDIVKDLLLRREGL